MRHRHRFGKPHHMHTHTHISLRTRPIEFRRAIEFQGCEANSQVHKPNTLEEEHFPTWFRASVLAFLVLNPRWFV